MSDTDWSVWQTDTQPQKTHDMNEAIDADTSEEIMNWEKKCSNQTNINDLSEYELIKVMTYFSFKERILLSKVCHKWKHCIDESFLSESVLSTSTIRSMTGLSEKAICLLIRKCRNVRHISLNGLNLFKSDLTLTEEEVQSTDNIVVTVVSNCSQLQSIDFGCLDAFDPYFESNVQFFSRLKRIVSQNIGERALNRVIDSQSLESIDISRNDRISRPEFKRLGPKITELNLTESEVIDESVIKELCIGNGKRIQKLSIDIKEKSVLTLICIHLIHLKSFKFCLYSKDCDFKQFQHLIDLNAIDMEVMDDSRLTRLEFTDMIRAMRSGHLSELRVMLSPINNIAINDDSLEELRQNCPTIQKLVIRGANSLTGTGMYAIAQLKNLAHLDLKNCLNISDQIEIAITCCPLLRQLILHNCSHITNSTVEAFIDRAKTSPKEEFYLDVIDTNVSQEALPLEADRPHNLKLLVEYEDCIYDCDHGWDLHNGYESGPEEYNDLIDDIDYYNEEDDNDYYDDYEDEDIDYEFS